MGIKQHAKKKSECVKAVWWLDICIAKYSISIVQWSRILHCEYKHVQFFNNVVNKEIRILEPQSVFLPTCFLNTRKVTRNAENLNYIVLSFVSKMNKRVNFWLLHILLSFYVRKNYTIREYEYVVEYKMKYKIFFFTILISILQTQ